MQRTCDACGVEYTAQRRTSKFCSSGCRTRFVRGARKAQVIQLPTDAELPTREVGLVEAATLTELDAAKRTESASGRAAVALAVRIDSSRDTGAAFAAVVREFRATKAEALANAAKPESVLDRARDEVAARRARKLA